MFSSGSKVQEEQSEDFDLITAMASNSITYHQVVAMVTRCLLKHQKHVMMEIPPTPMVALVLEQWRISINANRKAQL